MSEPASMFEHAQRLPIHTILHCELCTVPDLHAFVLNGLNAWPAACLLPSGWSISDNVRNVLSVT
jgi:hypothetical protein